MLTVLNNYKFKVRDAVIVSLIIHALLLLLIRNNKEAFLFEGEELDTKPVRFIFPDTPAEDVVPSKDAPYSDANRISKSPVPEKISEDVNPKIKGNSDIQIKPQVHSIENPVEDLKTAESESENQVTSSEISPEDSSLKAEPETNKKQERPSIKELASNPSKYLNSAELFNRGEGSARKFDDSIQFLEPETMKHPCWGNYPQRIQMIVRYNLSRTLPYHLIYTKAISVIRFRLFKDGHIEDLRIHKYIGIKQLANITHHAIDISEFPPYDCPYEFVNVQYTFYVGYDPEEVEDVGNN